MGCSPECGEDHVEHRYLGDNRNRGGKEFGDIDFMKMQRYHVILRLVIDGVASKPFSARTLSVGQRRGTEADIDDGLAQSQESI